MIKKLVNTGRAFLRAAVAFSALAGSGGPVAAQVQYWVGTGEGCTHLSIQSAINASASAGMTRVVINVTSETTDNVYYGQQIQIASRNLMIWGGWKACRQGTPWTPGHQVVSGYGGAAAPVIRVRQDAIVHLRGLDIQAGDPSGSSLQGGAIDWEATGRLTIDHTLIHYNAGVFGGGLRFHSDGLNDPAELTLGANTTIKDNSAHHGGGLYLSGRTVLTMTAPNVVLQYNVANPGSGGGIYMVGPARATIASPDPSGGQLGVFRSNQAPAGSGGAIFMDSDPANGGGARAVLYTADPSNPLSFVRNSADQGGAIFTDGTRGSAVVCSHGLHFRENSARDGAIATISGNRAFWIGRRVTSCASELSMAPPCPAISASSRCNVYQGNVAAGAVFRASNYSIADIERVRMTANVATTGTLFEVGPSTIGSPNVSRILLARSLIDSNQASALVSAQSGEANVFQVTIAGNNENAALNFRVLSVAGPNAAVSITNSVVSQVTPLGNAAGTQQITAFSTLSRNFVGVHQAFGHRNLVGSAVFLDSAYRMAPGSPGVDLINNADSLDIDGNPVNVDVPLVPNHPPLPVGDLGAYELQPAPPTVDAIWSDGYEGN